MSNSTPKNKWQLRRYLLSLDLADLVHLGKIADEVMANVRGGMRRYLDLPAEMQERRYYQSAVDLIEEAYQKRDTAGLGYALNFMIVSVNCDRTPVKTLK